MKILHNRLMKDMNNYILQEPLLQLTSDEKEMETTVEDDKLLDLSDSEIGDNDDPNATVLGYELEKNMAATNLNDEDELI